MAFSKESFEGLLIDGVKLTGKVLGKGAYGKVVEVVWNGTVCAAKQVHEILIEEVSPAERAKVVKDFEREFQTWAKLRHPNIVILLGVFFIKDSPRIVLEKMDTSLRLYLEKHTKADFPLVHKIDVLKQVAQGLSYLHNRNPPLVHHDLSPNNILLNEISFTAKLTDFGMTKAISPSALTRMSSIKGTLPFMAPESLRSQPRYDDKLDTFSYGNIIISTVTHKWPIPCDPNRYEGEKLVALTEYERREEYLKIFNDDENRVLAPTVKRCLENRPERRPTSLALVDEINAVSNNFVQAKALSQQMLELKSEKQQLLDQVVSQQESIKELQERIVDEEEEKSGLQRTNTLLLEEKSTLQGTIAHLMAEQAALQGTNTLLVEEKRALQGRNTLLNKEKRALQGRNALLVEEKSTLQGRNTRLVEEKIALQGTNECLVKEKRALQGRSTQLMKEKNTLEAQCTHLEGENTRLQKNKNFKTVQTHCTHLQEVNTHLQEEAKDQMSYSTFKQCHENMLLKATVSLSPDVETQLQEVRPHLDARLQENDVWYLVDVRWMKQWKKYVGFDSWDRTQVGDDSANPGPLDNSNLLLGRDDDTLKDPLMENQDYSLVPERAWCKLTAWYGIAEGSRPIARKVIELSKNIIDKHLKLLVYPIRLELGVHPVKEGGKTITQVFSRADRMSTVKEVIVKEFDLPVNKDTILWHQYMPHSYEQVKDDDTLQESGIYTGQLMFLEVKKDDGTWPRDTYTQGCMETWVQSLENPSDGGKPFTYQDVHLQRQGPKFGFSISGGQEEGCLTTISGIVPGGAAHMDSRLQVGDEIISINNHSTMNCTQREVLGLMKDLTTQGALEVTFRVRREMPLANSSFVSRTLPTGLSIPPRRSSKPPEGKREVVLTKSASENFGLTVKSNLHKKGCSINSVIPGSSAELSGQLYRGDILLGVNCQDVSSMEREDVIFLIKNSAPSVRLTVKQPDDSDGHTMHVY